MTVRSVSFPFAAPPAFGEAIEVADGVLWARLPLPFRLDHLNVYLIEDDGGWAVVDTGVDDPVCREGWQALFRGPLAGSRLSRVVVTHFHPDHVGLAGWLCERDGAAFVTTATCLDVTKRLLAGPEVTAESQSSFYLSNGMAAKAVASVVPETAGFSRYVGSLPDHAIRVDSGSTLTIGGRIFDVIFGNGHAEDQLMLHCREAGFFLSADQVIARITPYVGAGASDGDADTLGEFLDAALRLKSSIPGDTLVLPGHELPFQGLVRRCDELIGHHAQRCLLILDACAGAARSVADLVPLLFTRGLDSGSISFAFGEARAHINFLAARGLLVCALDPDGVYRARSLGAEADLTKVFARYD